MRGVKVSSTRMDAEEEVRFLAVAYKFLSEISYGEPASGLVPASHSPGSYAQTRPLDFLQVISRGRDRPGRPRNGL